MENNTNLRNTLYFVLCAEKYTVLCAMRKIVLNFKKTFSNTGEVISMAMNLNTNHMGND